MADRPDLKPDPQTYLPLTALSFDILLSMASGPLHGYGIIQDIETRAGRPMKSSTGTLYLAIQRLQRDGLIRRCHAEGAEKRRRLYAMTVLGVAVAAAEAERLAALVGNARDKDLLTHAALTAALQSPRGQDR